MARSIVTHIQHKGIKKVRFVMAGVNPFFQEMTDEDGGIGRFFYKRVTLGPMLQSEAIELLETKFMQVRRAAIREGISLKIDPRVIQRIVELSGGHPHILQLLGSHVVEHEDEDPDGVIDSNNLLGSLRRICYEDRANVYISTLHNLELHNKLDTLRSLLGLSPEFSARLLLPGFPTRIDRTLAKECVPPEDIQWLIDNNILSMHSDDY